MYLCARWIGLRVWNPNTVFQPRSANAVFVSAGDRTYGATASMWVGRARLAIRPASVRAPSR